MPELTLKRRFPIFWYATFGIAPVMPFLMLTTASWLEVPIPESATDDYDPSISLVVDLWYFFILFHIIWTALNRKNQLSHEYVVAHSAIPGLTKTINLKQATYTEQMLFRPGIVVRALGRTLRIPSSTVGYESARELLQIEKKAHRKNKEFVRKATQRLGISGALASFLGLILLGALYKHWAELLAIGILYDNQKLVTHLSIVPGTINREVMITKNSPRLTLLHFAVGKENLTLVELLLQRGANPNQYTKNSKGTALHLAVKLQNIAIVRILLKHGADPNISVDDLGSPMDLAKKLQKNEILILFK